MRKLSPLFFIILLGGILTWLVLRPDGATPGSLSGEPEVATVPGEEGVDPLDPLAPPIAGEGDPAGETAEEAAARVDAETGVDALAAETVFVTVVDAQSGKPMAGVPVFAGPPPDSNSDQWQLARALVTDAEGRFPWNRIHRLRWMATARLFMGDTPQLIAIAPDHGTSAWWPVPETTVAGHKLLVVAGGELSGTVRDRGSGRPVAGARVQLHIEGGREWLPWGQALTADAQGRYRVLALPPGRIFRVGAIATPRAEPFTTGAPAKPDVMLSQGSAVRLERAGDRAELDVEVFAHRVVRATFRLRFPSGTPVPASVTVTHGYTFRRPLGQHQPGGSFSSSGANERATVTFERDGILTSRERDLERTIDPADPTVVMWLPGGANHVSIYTADLSAPLWSAEITDGSTDFEVERLLQPRRAVVVQLVDERNEPLPRAGVEIGVTHFRRSSEGSETGQGLGSVTSDAQGRAVVTDLLRPIGPDSGHHRDRLAFNPIGAQIYRGEVWSSLDAARLVSGAELAALLLATPAGEPAVLTVPAGATRPVTFRVVDMSGRPLSGVEVQATPVTRFRQASRRSDTDGLVTFDYVGDTDDGGADPDPEARTNTLGVKVGADHGDPPAFAVTHGELTGTLALDDLMSREPLTDAEHRQITAQSRTSLDELRAKAETPGPEQAAAVRLYEQSRIEVERSLDRYARLVATGTKELDLTCVDGDGVPWAGITVGVGSDSSFDGGLEDPQVQTASDGTARANVPLDARTVWVRGSAADQPLFPAAFALQEGTKRYRVVLRRQKTLQIEVRWPAGVDGAAQLLQTTWFIRKAEDRSPIGTTWVRPPRGEAGATIELPALAIILEAQTGDGVFRGEVMIDVPAGGHVVLDMQRAAATTDVRIHVVDLAGKPVAGVIQAYAITKDEKTFTWKGNLDAEGAFAFPLVPGEYALMVVRGGTDVGRLASIAVPASGPVTVQLGKR